MGNTNVMSLDGKVPVTSKIGYAFSGISFCFCQLIPTFLIYFATENLLLSVGAVSLMMMLVKILDGVSDIVAGLIIDKTNTRKGKARPWMLRAAIPYGICMVLMFSVPANMGTTAKMLMLAVFYALTVSVFGTLIGVARLALISRMTDNKKERGILGVLGDGVACVCIGVGMAVALQIVAAVGWTMTFVLFGAIACIAGIICYALTRERTDELSEALDQEKQQQSTTIKVFFKTLFTNKYALLLLIYILLQQMAGGSITAGGTYYFQHVYGDINGFSKMMTITVVCAVIALIICPMLVKKLGTKKMFSLGCILSVVCYLAMIFSGRHNLVMLLICLPLSQVFGQMFLMTQAGPMAAAVSDYSYKKTGVHAEGVISSVVNIGIKIGTAVATGLLGMIMSIGGYAEGAAVQTERAVNSIYVAYMIVPLILFAVLAILYITTYRLETPAEQAS